MRPCQFSGTTMACGHKQMKVLPKLHVNWVLGIMVRSSLSTDYAFISVIIFGVGNGMCHWQPLSRHRAS